MNIGQVNVNYGFPYGVGRTAVVGRNYLSVLMSVYPWWISFHWSKPQEQTDMAWLWGAQHVMLYLCSSYLSKPE